jgi:hypothetical protein
MGILAASLVAGLLGYTWLRLCCPLPLAAADSEMVREPEATAAEGT